MGKFLVIGIVLSNVVFARGMQGGSLMQYHTRSLSSFSSRVEGNPLLIGATGCLSLSRDFCVGGQASAAFVSGAGVPVSFPMGYAGLMGQYSLNQFLSFRLTVGGGAYRLERVVAETTQSKMVEKISNGAFGVAHPSLTLQVEAMKGMFLVGSLGYFLPTVEELRSFTLGINLLFGRL